MHLVDSRNALRDALNDSRWLQFLPQHLRRAYRSQRQTDFDRLALVGAPLLPLLYLALNVVLILLYDEQLHGHDLRLWLTAEIISGALVLLGVVAVRSARGRAHFNAWIPVVLALILMTKISVGMSMRQADLANGILFSTALVQIVGILALDLAAVEAVGAVLPGFFLLLAMANFARFHFWFSFLCFYALVAVVCLVIRVIHENSYKKYFLQSVLLSQEEKEVTLLNQRLGMLTHEDILTGLANRRSFFEVLEREWRHAVRVRGSLAVLVMDVDGFQAYNSQGGAPVGDRLLQRIAAVLRATGYRNGDVAARYGSDEFALLLSGADAEGAVAIASDLVAALSRPRSNVEPESIMELTLSIGIAACKPASGDDARAMLRAADAALEQSQREGGNRMTVSEVRFMEDAFFGGRKAYLSGQSGEASVQEDAQP